MVARYNPLTSTIDERSLNSCLLPLASVHLAAITTAEGLCSASRSSPADLPAANGDAGANTPTGAVNGAGKGTGLKQQRDPHTCHKGGRAEQPHAVQQRLAGFHASQCGFCTPGMSIALYAAIRRRRAGASGEGVEAVSGLTEQEVEEAMAGNLCRCTGYRPILDACKSFAGANGSAAASAAAAEAAGGLMDLEELGSVGTAGMRSCTVLDISEFAPAAISAQSHSEGECGGKDSSGGSGGAGKCSKSCSGKCSGLCGTPRKPLPRYDPTSDPPFPAWLTAETQRQLIAQQKQAGGGDKMLGWEVWEESGAGEAAGRGSDGANGEASAAGEGEAGEQAEEVKGERKGRKVAWVAPRSLEELRSVLLGGKGEGGAGDGGEVRLVVGNTAVGVYPELGRYDGVARVTRVDLKRLPELQRVAWEEGPGDEESEGGEGGARVMGIRFGAAVCLANVIAVLDTVAGKGTDANPSSSSNDNAPVVIGWDEAKAAGASAAAAAEVFSGVAAHLRKVAGPHVRNAASIGGNLVLAASQRAFPSDVATLLLALNASVCTATPTPPTASSGAGGGAGEGAGGRDGWVWEEVTLEQFLLRGPLPSTTLLHSVFLPCPSLPPSTASAGQQLVFDSFRASVRPSGNAYAYVNAAFLLRLTPSSSSSSSSSSIIHSARLVFGAFGSPHAIRARQAESCLLSAAANGVLTPGSVLEAVRAVRGEVVPPEGTRWAEYRTEAAVGFLFSFLSRHLPQIDPPQKSLQDVAGAAAASATGAAGGSVSGDGVRSSSEQQHVVMRGQQVYSVTNDVFPLALPLPKLGVDLQATGHAIFVDDIPVPSSCLYAAFAVSTHASARITSRCYTAALASPGVVAVLDASHLPPGGANVGSNLMGSVDPLFAEGRSEYYGQPLALVVADSYRHAQEGARKVICTYDSSPPPAAAHKLATQAEPAPAADAAAAAAAAAERPAAGPTAAAEATESGSSAGEASGANAILTIEQAEAAGSFFPLNPMFAMALPRRGNFQEAFDKSPLKITGAEVRSGSQQHFYMEPQVAMVVPDEGGALTVYSATQSPQITQESVAVALGLPASCVRVVTRRLGGGFGGKACQSIWVAVACALAAQHLHRPVAVACALAAQQLHRPVRMALERKADTALVGGRHESRARYDVGFDETGRVHALRVSAVLNGGCSETMSNWLPMAYGPAVTQYDWGALEIDFKIVKTNLPTRVTVRAPGEVQGVLVAETVMDHVAAALNLDPVLVRERNHITTDSLRAFFPRDIPPSTTASPAEDEGAKEEKAEDEGAIAERVWREVKSLSSYSKRAAAVQEFNAAHKWRKRGLAVAPVHYKIAIMGKPARVTVFGDSSVAVETGGVEMGQGLFTKVRQAVANSLNQLWLNNPSSSSSKYGVDVSCIRVIDNDSISLAHGGITAGSSTSEASCAGVQLACDQLLPLLRTAKAAAEKVKACKRLGVTGGGPGGMFGGGAAAGAGDVVVGEEDVASWKEVVGQAKAMRMYLSAQAIYQPKPLPGSFFLSYFNFGAAVSEVEVDVVTGSVSVLRCDIHYDCGRSLNPAVDIGQVEGAFVQGQGFFTTEEVVVEEASGRLLTDGTWSYKVPSFDTAPRQLNVSLLQGSGNDRGVLSSKASGEPPLLLAVSIHSAIRYAIAAARREFGNPHAEAATSSSDEFVRLDSPATMAVVQQACGSHLVEAYLEKQLMASGSATGSAAVVGGAGN
ncbi:unnamed protein product [Closterium sp. NIES-64]|nr:unnamed protein product [Closterium sp. NIES-64]